MLDNNKIFYPPKLSPIKIPLYDDDDIEPQPIIKNNNNLLYKFFLYLYRCLQNIIIKVILLKKN